MASFPQQQQYWEGSTFQLLGQGTRYHKVAFLSIKASITALHVLHIHFLTSLSSVGYPILPMAQTSRRGNPDSMAAVSSAVALDSPEDVCRPAKLDSM